MAWCWKWSDMSVIWDWEAAGRDSCGFFPMAETEPPNLLQEPTLSATGHIWQLRRLGQYENRQNRLPPSVGILVVLGLALFCICKITKR